MTDFDLYNERILQLAESISREGRLVSPDASATAHSRLCGSRITIDLKLEDRTITDYAHEPKACVIGQAVAALVAEVVVGLTIEEVGEGADILSALLRDKTPPPAGSWAGLEAFLPVADVRSRHASALLPFQALQRAIAAAGPADARQRSNAAGSGQVAGT